MLLSSLQHHTGYYDRLRLTGPDAIPSIDSLQKIIEGAWGAGFDRQGAEQLGGRLVKTRNWIGATEVYTLLSHSGIRYLYLASNRSHSFIEVLFIQFSTDFKLIY